MFKFKEGKFNKKKIMLFALTTTSLVGVVTNTTISCSQSKKMDFSNLTLSQLVNILYGDIKITPTEYASKYPANSENWPISNITSNFFNGFPEKTQDINVDVKEVLRYEPGKGEMIIIIKYSKGSEYVEKQYRIEGFVVQSESQKPFEEIVNELYSDVAIYLTPKAEELTASDDIWSIPMINPQYFYGLPTSKEGISVSVNSIELNERNCSMDISYKFSRESEYLIKTYTVTGFKKPELLWDIVNEIYKDISITPTLEATKLAATEENWPISKINSNYFNGLPLPKDGIIPNIESVSYKPKDGCMFIDYIYTKGSQKVSRTYLVEGFKKI